MNRVATQSGFSDFLDLVRILKIGQDNHDKWVIYAQSHDKVRIISLIGHKCLVLLNSEDNNLSV